MRSTFSDLRARVSNTSRSEGRVGDTSGIVRYVTHSNNSHPDTTPIVVTSIVFNRPIERLEAAAAEAGRSVRILDTRRVKSHSEGVAHVVVDARVE
jgi:tRNA G37 N-methylase Trm5